MISQSLFDETLLENQEVFEYTDDQAVKETIDEFQKSSSLEHISLTHPSSPRGRRDRDLQRRFVESFVDIEGGENNFSQKIIQATSILTGLQQQQPQKRDKGINESRTNLLSLWYLMLQKDLWTKCTEYFIGTITSVNGSGSEFVLLIDFVLALFSGSSPSLHPLGRELKCAIAPFWFEPQKVRYDIGDGGDPSNSVWYSLLEMTVTNRGDDGEQRSVPLSLVQLARYLCNGCEGNKKSFVKAGLVRRGDKTGLELLVHCLDCNIDASLDDTRNGNGGVDHVGPDQPSVSVNGVLSSFALVRETCRLLAVLSKFQPTAEPNESSSAAASTTSGGREAMIVSSAHANVKELHKVGAVPRLHRIAKSCLQYLRQGNYDDADANRNLARRQQDALCESLSALRAMAIDNDIVQNMIALGILDTVRNSLEVIVQVATAPVDCSPSTSGISSSLSMVPSSIALATATLGLVRNLCANDEVKTTICKSSLPSILQIMQHYLNEDKLPGSQHKKNGEQPHNKEESREMKGHAILHEHACGILGAMSLREPQNAHLIVEGGGHVLIFQAMRAFPDKVTLQRQCCLAVRNIASRISDKDKAKILDAGAEDVLKAIAGKHPASSEESYAALRDLGCNPTMFQLDEYGNFARSTTEAFGSVKSNFRPVYE